MFFDEQKANFGHFNELKTIILCMIPRILNIYQVKKQGMRQFERVPQFEYIRYIQSVDCYHLC